MKQQFTANVWKEGKWFIAHCNEIELASQGLTEDEALINLKEALELHFEEPVATIFPKIHTIEVEVYT